MPATGCSHPISAGTGGSSRPEAIEDYDIVALTGDLIGVLDDIGAERAVLVGHDWGSMVVWQTALLHPERLAGVVGMSVPFLPRGDRAADRGDALRVRRQLLLHRVLPGAGRRPTPNSAAIPRRTMRRLLAGMSSNGDPDPNAMALDGRGFVDRIPEPDGLPDWLTQDELDHYIDDVPAHRVHRRPQLVPELRPQLGAHTATRGSEGGDSVAVHRRAVPTRCWSCRRRASGRRS